MEILLNISKDIIIIGGAICMFFLVFICFFVLRVLIKINGIITDIQEKYERIISLFDFLSRFTKK